MKLYCTIHHIVEHLTEGEAHDLIQSLLADLAGEQAEPSDPPKEGEHRSYLDYQQCPTNLLRAYRDPEMYSEHLQYANDARRAG